MNIHDNRRRFQNSQIGLAQPTMTATRSATDFEIMQQEHIERLKAELAEARAEIAVLKAALWYFGNSLGPDVVEELENALPERLSRKINLMEIENTNGEAALEAAERGE